MENLSWEDVGKGAGRLKISAEVTVDHAADLHRLLINGLERFEHLQIDCSQSEAVDFYAVQLLCSAHRTAISRGKRLAIQGIPSARMTEIIGILGFLRNEGCSLCPLEDRCLWEV